MKHLGKLLFLLLLAGQLSFGQSISQKIDSVAKSYYEQSGIGISIGFIQDNQECYSAYGTLSKESNISINKNSVFEIASITKIITATLIAQAELEGKLKLNDYIDSYLPEVYTLHDDLKNKIKISDLASHQSGLPDLDFRKLIELNPQQPVSSVTQKILTEMVNSCETLIDYGTYRYSTLGYTLLGQILEPIYGKTYDTLVREKIVQPLQLTNTFTKEFQVYNRTNGYNPEGGEQEFFNWNITAPAGLLKSSASDMVTYLKALLNTKTVRSKAAFLTETIVYADENRSMGLGLNIIKDGDNTLYLKSGDSMGQSSMLCYNRADDWGIVILLNHRNSPMRQELLNVIYEVALKKL
ncbi:serine hydrolase domain-containing protein [Flagellimonas sp. S174]|uniref:serine hydrolase domain-containing protein n=1 Tax=Flagellimonas sp. S174 TaxID=3410790 RepID=UPI003BF5A26C